MSPTRSPRRLQSWSASGSPLSAGCHVVKGKTLYAFHDVAGLVDGGTLHRGVEYANQHMVLAHVWSGDRTRLRGSVRGSGQQRYTVEVSLEGPAGRILGGLCSCPVGVNCKHAVAVLLAALAASGGGTQPAAGRSAIALWQRTLAQILPAEEELDEARYVDLALQMEFRVPSERERSYRPRGSADVAHLAIRPLREGVKGWVKTGAGWDDLDSVGYRWRAPDYDPAQVRALLRLRSECVEAVSRYSYAPTPQHIHFDGMTSEAGWAALEQLGLAGVPIVDASKAHSVITVLPAEWVIDLKRTSGGLEIRPQVRLDGESLDHSRLLPVGMPVTGLVSWPADQVRSGDRPSLWRFSRAIPEEAKDFVLSGSAVMVPGAEVDVFLAESFPRFDSAFAWQSSDESFAAPPLPEPTLGLTLSADRGHRIVGTWWLSYDAPLSNHPRRRPLSWSSTRPRTRRDLDAEGALLSAALATVAHLPGLWGDEATPTRLRDSFELAMRAAIDFLHDVVPQLTRQGVVVEIDERMPNYREAADGASIHVSTPPPSHDEGGRDWFDLVVRVLVEGQEVPFESIFVALATGQSELILPDGLHFALNGERFNRLRDLIEEARQLSDHSSTGLRLSRFQATLWDDLAELGIVDEQAQAWRRAAATFRPEETLTRQLLPKGFTAQLREYQHEGYDWMCFLGQHGLGGILADDMGLGKTVQALAFVAHQRATGSTREPFVVVAPTSVVSNWAAESAKFTPGLEVVVVNETRARRGAALAELLAERAAEGRPVDIVATSYTIFRIDFEDYSSQSWSGLLMDEAQFLKNHQSVAYRCARKLVAEIKIAITGTPMENNLMELWSLMSIVAPGLFPSPKRFAEYYAKPIEREANPERLQQLKRRIRPLMLRRTKEQVAKDLPLKQEQVLEVDLNPAHRKVYDTYLARERQKILGLVNDLDANRFEIFRSLTLLRQASLDVSLVDPAHAAVSSTKLDLLDDLLADIVSEGHRVLVFSQFTSFLDRARQRLDASGVGYAYLDGRTRDRAAVIERFRHDRLPVFFISLKAGGFGLNLTEADYCILLDPWWNPAAEAQAIDRTHRIGQKRNVMVYRLVARGTIEDKVMALKSAKSQLFGSVMAEDGAAGSATISANDIRSLLE